MAPPDPFLTPDAGVNNASGAWKTILDHEGLVVKTGALPGPASNLGNVWIMAGPRLLGLQFASDRNERYFVEDLAAPDKFKSDAWVGDDNGCESRPGPSAPRLLCDREG